MKRLGVLWVFVPWVVWGMQVSATLYQVGGYQRYVSNRFFSSAYDELDGEVGGRWMVSPDFSLSEGVMFDAKVDLYLSRRYWTNAIETVVKEAYSDLLLWDIFSLRMGYVAIDYGYNGLFHPLRLMDLSPVISQKTSEILSGTERSGYRGLPLFRVRMAPWIGDVNVSVEQNLLFLEATNIFSNYLLSSTKVSSQGTEGGIFAGYFPWKKKEDMASGVVGWFLAFPLPGHILVMHEGLYREKSFWVFYDGGNVVSNRTGEFVNVSLEVKQTCMESFFHGKITWTLEYCFLGEGLSFELVAHTLDFLTNSLNQAIYGKEMLPSYRLFRHWYRGEIGYEIPSRRIGFSYRLVFPESLAMVSHLATFSLNFDQARISLFSGWNTSEERYALLYGNIPLSIGTYLELPL
ncbi:MAG: hypothetical protein HPY78_02975 [Brevinematales bacterium]|nr:hypothetical protein [Brevinematales bacterium]